MTFKEAVLRAKLLSREENYLVTKTAQPFEGKVLVAHSVHIDGHSSVSQRSYEACFDEIEDKISAVSQ